MICNIHEAEEAGAREAQQAETLTAQLEAERGYYDYYYYYYY